MTPERSADIFAGMINEVVKTWHHVIANPSEAGDVFDGLIAEDATFHSPIVFTPIRGKEMVKLYLTTAAATLAGPDNGFHYVNEVVGPNMAVLEFETTVDGKYVNGVDMITCDDTGKITEFKVMVRPLQAINAVHEKMRAALARF